MKLLLASFLLSAASALPAQQQATTLFTLAESADVVVIATAIAASDPSVDFHRIEFHTDQVLKGSAGESFAILEPAGRCCGRALSAMTIGDQVIAFLDYRGPGLHPLGGSRGISLATPEIVAHVRQLLAAQNQKSYGEILASGLSNPDQRVRIDAALALAALPSTRLGATANQQILSALQIELQAASASLPAMIDASVRFLGDAAATTLVQSLLTTDDDSVSNLMTRGLARLSGDSVHQSLMVAALPNPLAQQRACELAACIPNALSLPMLRILLTQSPRVALAASEALLANGVSAESIAPLTDSEVLKVAVERHSQLPKLRVVGKGNRQ